MPVDLESWLEHIGRQHPQAMALGLDRVREVAARLDVLEPATQSVIVAGTNGKGSACVVIESVLRCHGYRVGCTLSPHVRRYNERFRIDGQEVPDAVIVDALQRVDAARGGVALTYFEYSALAALCVIADARVDVAVLEIGLGGRLDAFNVIDADVAIVTSIGLDHQAWLGDTLDLIGAEKAGVFRPRQWAVIGADVPPSVDRAADVLGCRRVREGEAFSLRQRGQPESWSYLGVTGLTCGGDSPGVAPRSVGVALATCELLVQETPDAGARRLDSETVVSAVAAARLEGRFQVEEFDGVTVILDVAHNPAAARYLNERIRSRFPARNIVGVMGMLEDKDPGAFVTELADVQTWVLVDTTGWRARSADDLALALSEHPSVDARIAGTYATIAQALAAARSFCTGDDVILACGSFSVVSKVEAYLGAPTARDAVGG